MKRNHVFVLEYLDEGYSPACWLLFDGGYSRKTRREALQERDCQQKLIQNKLRVAKYVEQSGGGG